MILVLRFLVTLWSHAHSMPNGFSNKYIPYMVRVNPSADWWQLYPIKPITRSPYIQMESVSYYVII